MDAIYQHFRAEEYAFIDKILGITVQVENEYIPQLTDFLDPRQRYITETIIGGYEQIKVQFFGGVEHAERRRALIYPDYYTPTEADFEIALFHIRYPVKFTTLTHQKILGTLMSLGMKRDIFGDILNNGTEWQLLVESNMKDYLTLQLEKIGKVNVMLEETNLTEAVFTPIDWEDIGMTVSSMRLDVIISNAHHISRQKAKQIIVAGLAKVNWKTVENPDFECEQEDVLSVRGYGRVKILEIAGRTKKDKIRIEIGYIK